MWRGIRAVLFDLDGTLIDSAADLGGAVDRMRTDRGLASLPMERYRSMAGAGARGMLHVGLGVTPDHPDYETLRLEFLANYERQMTASTRVFDGVDALVSALERQGLAWGIVTNKAIRFAQPLAAALAPLHRAGVLIGGDSTAHSKPHPLPLLEAARRLGHEPCACCYVGDDERDIEAGRAAGMHTVAATYGYLGEGADPRRWGADASVAAPLELLDLLQSTASA